MFIKKNVLEVNIRFYIWISMFAYSKKNPPKSLLFIRITPRSAYMVRSPVLGLERGRVLPNTAIFKLLG